MTMREMLWDDLWRVRSMAFVSRGTSATGWSGTGSGLVAVESPSPAALVFRESGIWRPDSGGRGLSFRNAYRWTFLDQSVRLEHLRFGDEQPVYLFDLAPDDNDGAVWSSQTPHLCRHDTYSATLRRASDTFFLHWSIVGPEKQEDVAYTYSPGPAV